MLKYRTIADVSAQGKQKVYFCCHPDDYDLYFDDICRDIFQFQDNCAIFYETDSSAALNGSDLSLNFSGMSLFIVPVTRRLLVEDNRAMNTEIKYAIEKHIPVLPILLEDDITELFNSKSVFANIQYLNKYNRDSTAINYTEKLKRYINTVLVRSDMAESIKKEFKSYIFLSYRKTDRLLAQELMRSIHKIDFCRDVAIWYDEYLVPGEDFNEAIQSTLNNCDAFVLNVTPSLLDPDNYIVKYEYPQALSSKKPILAVEMEPTDHSKLIPLYAGIDEKIIPSRSDDLRSGLNQSLIIDAGKKSLLSNDDSAEHLYYIGLAYKYGIDVEIDTEKAIEIILRAANKGYYRAFVELAWIYQNGEGVKINHAETIKWLDKFLDATSEPMKDLTPGVKIDFDKIEEDNYLRAAAFQAKGDIYLQQGRYSEAEDAYTQLTALGMYMHRYTDMVEIGYSGLGDVFFEKKDYSNALSMYADALKSINGSEESYELSRDIAVLYHKIGNCYNELGESSSAEEYYRKGLELLSRLAEEYESPQTQSDLITYYNSLLNISDAQGKSTDTITYYKKIINILERLVRDSVNPNNRLCLSLTYGGYAVALCETEDMKTAQDYCFKAIDIAETFKGSVYYEYAHTCLYAVYLCLGGIFLYQKDYQNSKKYYMQALEYLQNTKKEPKNLIDEKATLYGQLAEVLGNLNETQQAMIYYDAAVKLRQQQCTSNNTERSRHKLAMAYCKILFINEADTSTKIVNISKATEIWKQLFSNTHSAEYKRMLDMAEGAINALSKQSNYMGGRYTPSSSIPSSYTPVYTPSNTQNSPAHGKATASLVFGVISIVFSVLACGGLIFSIIGIVLGTKARKLDSSESLSSVGIILSIIGLVLSLCIPFLQQLLN